MSADKSDRGGASYLYEQLRPEYVRKYGQALNPDAYSGFLAKDAASEADTRDLVAASQHLRTQVCCHDSRATVELASNKEVKVIPAFAAYLEDNLLLTLTPSTLIGTFPTCF